MSNANFAHSGSLAEICSFAVTHSPPAGGSGWPRAAASSLHKFANFATDQVRNSQHKLLVISGPTATGKTQLAFKLAGKFNGELISADSRQVYKGMDIVTGKDWGTKNKEQKTKNKIHIWGYDAVEPNGEWSASHFVKFAKEVIADIQKRGKLPIVVGGTGLYIANLLNPPETLNIPPDKKLRVELEKLSLPKLQSELIHLDGKRFNQMNNSDQSNPRRLIRAIEVVKFLLQSRILLRRTKLHKKGRAFLKRPGLFKHIGLTASLDVIDKRIENRVRQRIKMGAEQEVRELVEKYGWNSALKFTIGYKEWRADSHGRLKRPRNDLDGQCPKEEIIKNWTIHEKQYARRQLTWMAKYSPDKLFDISSPNCHQDIEAYVSRWYYGKR